MLEDERILALYWARDAAAIQETDVKYGARLHGLSRRLLPVREDAEECVNDTYLGAWNAIPPARPRALLRLSGEALPQSRLQPAGLAERRKAPCGRRFAHG